MDLYSSVLHTKAWQPTEGVLHDGTDTKLAPERISASIAPVSKLSSPFATSSST